MSDYLGEEDIMADDFALSAKQVDRILTGEGSVRVAQAVRAIRGTLITPPSPAAMSRHLAEMSAAAGKSRSRLRPRSVAVAAAFAAVLAGGALAALPEDLPNGPSSPPAPAEAVQRAEEARADGLAQARAGQAASVTVQGEGSNEHGKAVSELARTTEAEGKEKGQEISALASSKSQEHRQDGEQGGGKPDELPGNGNQP